MTKTFTLRRQVEFNHCDPAGMVFYPRYFEMISATIERFFADAIDFGWSKMADHEGGTGTPMGQIEVRFTAASRLGDWLDLTLAVTRVGTASATFDIRCFGGAEQRFTCTATVVFAGTGGDRARPWPDAVRECLRAFQEDRPDTEKKGKT